MRAGVALLCLAACFSKPPRPLDSDAPAGDGPIISGTEPRMIARQPAARNNGNTLSYSITVPDDVDRFLITTVQVGGDCNEIMQATASVSAFDGTSSIPLTMLVAIEGTPCSTTTHSEQWQLLAPPVGSLRIDVVLAGTAMALHSGTTIFAGVDQATPARGSIATSGESARADIAIDALAGDLVYATVGHGTTLDMAVAPDKEIYKRNVDSSTTLNNSGASTATGDGLVEMKWDAVGVDQWQMLATTLQPSGR